MKKKIVLSKEEEAIILKRREEEESKNPIKVGYAKHNLYWQSDGTHEYEEDFAEEENSLYFSKEEVDRRVNSFKGSFVKCASKGAKFDCYDQDGQELWYDQEFGIEGMPDKWAKHNLTNIQDLRKNKK